MMSPEKPPPTLRAIAKAAGVSVSTVSCALRGEPGVAPKTAERIRNTAKKLGWRANPLVSAWLAHVRSAKPHEQNISLGYLISDKDGMEHYFQSPVYRAYHTGAEARARQLGFTLEPFHLEATGLKRLNQILASRSIPGVIIAPLGRSGNLDGFDWSAFSCAAIAHSLTEPRIHRAANHHFHSVVLAYQKLVELGYRRIGLAIAKGLDRRAGGTLSGGYWSAALAAGTTPLPPLLPEMSPFESRHFTHWFREHRPDAVIGYSLIKDWLAQMTVSVPSAVAFANLDWHPSYGPQAGIYQKPDLIGAAAVDLVTSQIFRNERGIPHDQKLILIESEWVDGPSAPGRRD
jgi:DNA-binding LacI/PurR family transcriptional regulator